MELLAFYRWANYSSKKTNMASRLFYGMVRCGLRINMHRLYTTLFDGKTISSKDMVKKLFLDGQILRYR
jgi:hypothetical protein